MASVADVLTPREERAPADHAHLARSDRFDAGICTLLHPSGAPQQAETAPTDTLTHLAEALSRSEIGAALVDLTRPDFAIPVVCAIAPQLQPMPGERITPRLARIIAAAGGGSSWTGGIPLC